MKINEIINEDKAGYNVPYLTKYVMTVNGVDKFHFTDPEEAKEYAIDYHSEHPGDNVKVVVKRVADTKYSE
jgi:hypothetical protein